MMSKCQVDKDEHFMSNKGTFKIPKSQRKY